MESVKAQKYEKRYPGTGCPEAQKEERQERMDFKDEARLLRRTGRNRGIIVPRLPWLEKEQT